MTRLSDELYAAAPWVTGAYLVLVLLAAVRLEVLKAQHRLPTGLATATSPLRWKKGLWARIMGEAQREVMGRVFRLIFTGQHNAIGDGWLTAAIFGCRALVGVWIVLVIALLATGFLG